MWLILLLRNGGKSSKPKDFEALISSLEGLAKKVHTKVSYRVAAIDCEEHSCDKNFPLKSSNSLAGSDSQLFFVAEGISYLVDKKASLTAQGLDLFVRDNMPTDSLVLNISKEKSQNLRYDPSEAFKSWLTEARKNRKEYVIACIKPSSKLIQASSKLFTVLAHMHRNEAAFAEVPAEEAFMILSEWTIDVSTSDASGHSLLLALSTKSDRVLRFPSEFNGLGIVKWLRLDVLQKGIYDSIIASLRGSLRKSTGASDQSSLTLPYREVNRRAVNQIGTARELLDHFLAENQSRAGSIVGFFDDSASLSGPFEALVGKFGDLFRFGEVNITENPALAQSLLLPASGYPYFCLFTPAFGAVSDNLSDQTGIIWYNGAVTKLGLYDWIDEFLREIRCLSDYDDLYKRLILPSRTVGSALLLLDYDESHLHEFESIIVAARPQKSLYGKMIGPVRKTLRGLGDLSVLDRKGTGPILVLLLPHTSGNFKKEYYLGSISNQAVLLRWIEKHQAAALSYRNVASPILVERKVKSEDESKTVNLDQSWPDQDRGLDVDNSSSDEVEVDTLGDSGSTTESSSEPGRLDDTTQLSWWWNTFSTPRVLFSVAESIESVNKSHIATFLVCVMVFVVLVLVPTRRAHGWHDSFDDTTSPDADDLFSNFIGGILYVHQNYLSIISYISKRTLPCMVLLGQGFLKLSSRFGLISLSDIVMLFSILGRWSSVFYVVSLLLLLDIMAAVVLAGEWVISFLNCEPAKVLLSKAWPGLEQSRNFLEALTTDSVTTVPSSVLSPGLFLFGDPFGFHGGFPGGGFQFGPRGFIPGGDIHGIPGIPYMGYPPPQTIVVEERVIVEERAPVHQAHQSSITSQQEQEEIQAASFLFAFLDVAILLLFLAPIAEEIVFRFGLGTVGRIIGSPGGKGTEWSKCRGFVGRGWALWSSLLFGAVHLCNHIPAPSAVPKLLDQGEDRVIFQLHFALLQFLVTLCLSRRMLTPIYQRHGLAAAIGAHTMWNACTLVGILEQVIIRTVYLLARTGYAKVAAMFPAASSPPTVLSEEEVETARNQEATEKMDFSSLSLIKYKAD